MNSIGIGFIFQSTHPVRGGTAAAADDNAILKISIHPPREGWDAGWQTDDVWQGISIHPPREGWDR